MAEQNILKLTELNHGLLAKSIEANLTRADFLHFVIAAMQAVLPFDAAWLLIKEGNQLTIEATSHAQQDDVGRSFLLNESISGYAAQQQRAVVVDDINNLSNLPAELAHLYQPPTGTSTMQSQLATPLIGRDGVLGVLNLERAYKHGFDAAQQESVNAVAMHIAFGLDMLTHRDEERIVQDISRLVIETKDIGSTLNSVLQRICQWLGASAGQILLPSADGARLEIKNSHPTSAHGQSYPLNDCVSGRAFLANAAQLVPNVQADPSYKQVLGEAHRTIHSEFALPIRDDANDIVGVFNFESSKPDGFDAALQTTLRDFVQTQRQSLVTLLQQRHRRLLSQKLNTACELMRNQSEEIFGQILRRAGSCLIIEATSGQEHTGTQVKIGQSVTGYVIESNAEKYLPDVSRDDRYQPYLGQEMNSEMAVPLRGLKGEVIGVLNFESTAIDYFTDEDAWRIGPLANQIGLTIAAFDAQRKTAESRVTGDIVHRLNNPLGAISARIELLKEHEAYKLVTGHDYLNRFVERTVRDLSKANDIVKELRLVLKGEAGERVAVSAQQVVAQAWERYTNDLHTDDRVNVWQLNDSGVPTDAWLLGNESILRSIFWNLISNACKAMPQGGTVVVQVRADAAEDKYVLAEVRDAGVGIEPWRIEHIWDPNETTSTDANAPGHGLGLWWVRERVLEMGGAATVLSKVGEGTCVSLRLPRAERPMP